MCMCGSVRLGLPRELIESDLGLYCRITSTVSSSSGSSLVGVTVGGFCELINLFTLELALSFIIYYLLFINKEESPFHVVR